MDFRGLKKVNFDGVDCVKLFFDDELVFKAGYKNWVRYSINADGTIYNNGLGYKDGIRLSSSGGESAQDGSTATGFIPVKAGDVIRIAGCNWYDQASAINYLIVYSSAFAKVYTATSKSSYQTSSFVESITYDAATDVCTVVLKSGVSGYAYFRVSARESKGANVIITINEEIA